jgi:tetratricopeptide (TPR) repeat protein
MPPKPTHTRHAPWTDFRHPLPLLVAMIALPAFTTVRAQTAQPTPIRSRTIELHYRTIDADENARVELWYTRDRGATWVRYGNSDEGQTNPILFTAPAEGLYGFTLTLADAEASNPQVPGANPNSAAPHAPPQHWVFIDSTPPLVQWDGVEAAEDFATRRVVHLRWTAYDDHLTARPVVLAWQSSVDGAWQAVAPPIANTGRYDWTVPADVTGQITLKLTVSDLGGHAVERIYGPVPIDRWLKTSATGLPATQPAAVAETRPATESLLSLTAGSPPAPVDIEKRLKAQDLHRQGAAHLKSGRYAVAAERFRAALEADPDLLAAQCDLAGIYYLQQDYTEALELYNTILARDPRYVPALRGASLAYGALRQYPQTRDMLKRLLAVMDNDAQAWFDLGDAMFMMGDTAAARSHWTRATTVDPTAEAVIRKARRRLELYGADVDPGAR